MVFKANVVSVGRILTRDQCGIASACKEHPHKRRFFFPRNSKVLDHIVLKSMVRFLKMPCVCIAKL